MADVVIAMPKRGRVNSLVQEEENNIEESIQQDSEYPNTIIVQLDNKDFTEDIRNKILGTKKKMRKMKWENGVKFLVSLNSMIEY